MLPTSRTLKSHASFNPVELCADYSTLGAGLEVAVATIKDEL